MPEPSLAPVDRCPRCLCADCGGRLGQHHENGCLCENCGYSYFGGCRLSAFTPPEGIGYFAEQLAPLLSSHLNAAAARRCLAVAHAAHHALQDYDHPGDAHV